MPSLPLLLALADDLNSVLTEGGYADDFGYEGYHPLQLQQSIYLPQYRILGQSGSKSFNMRGQRRQQGKSQFAVGKEAFQVSMDVQQFKPNELTVKTIDDCIVVEGKHDEREDEHGVISRHFIRRYALPKDYDPAQVTSTLSSDGVLTVGVPKPRKSDESNERVVPIQQTGPAHISVKDNAQETSKEDGDKIHE